VKPQITQIDRMIGERRLFFHRRYLRHQRLKTSAFLEGRVK
jgi:hypothetical protein